MSCLTRLWFQPIWKILGTLDHFSSKGWKQNKVLKPPATVLLNFSLIVTWDSSSSFRWQTPSFANLLKSMDGSQRIYGRHFYHFKGYLSPRFPWNIQGPISLTKPTIWGPKDPCFRSAERRHGHQFSQVFWQGPSGLNRKNEKPEVMTFFQVGGFSPSESGGFNSFEQY